MEKYKISCFIPGNKNTFTVDVEKTQDQDIHHLKKLIKADMVPALNHVTANFINLYQVTIDKALDKRQRTERLETLYKDKQINFLDEDAKLSENFDKSPPDGQRYCVIVEIPEGESIYH